MIGVYAQTEIEWTRSLRTTLGLRADVYQFAVTSDNPLNSGEGSDALVSPKFGAVFGPWAGTEIYANAGMGFHSNDARGAVIRVDPASGEPVGPRDAPGSREGRGSRVFARCASVGFSRRLRCGTSGLDSELLFVGDAGTTEAGRPSRRVGVEWTNYARLRPWLDVGCRVWLVARAIHRRRPGRQPHSRCTRSGGFGWRHRGADGSRSLAACASATSVRAR